jgi:S1-C subfamily serine protease
VTANHVVRRGQREIENLRVQLRALPGESLEARLLEHVDPYLDLAVVAVPDVRRRAIPVGTLPFDRLGDPATLRRGDEVYHVGYPLGSPWRANVSPDHISDQLGDTLTFESSSIAPGNSGGGLFDKRWQLVGMVRADQPPDGVAVSMKAIRDTLVRWGYPVGLTEPKTPSSPGPSQPEPEPVRPEPPPGTRLAYTGFDAIGRYPTIVQVYDPG